MAKKKIPVYSEGDCFVFPLEHGGFARGVMARCNYKTKTQLGYFFPPIYKTFSEAVISEDLKRENAILLKFFSELGITEGDWKIIGKIDPWIKEDWPIPVFGTFLEITNQGELRQYDESLEYNSAFWTQVTPSEAMKYPASGSGGHRYIEIEVSRILHNIPPVVSIHQPAMKNQMMAEKRIATYSEGDCFVFPLKDGGFARGVIARCNYAWGEMLVYFFPPIYQTPSEAVISEDLKREKAVLVRLLGDKGLMDIYEDWKIGDWTVIGKIEPWIREDWPIPVFGRIYALTDQGQLCYYDDQLQIDFARSIKVSVAEAKKCPEDSFAWYGYIQNKVSQILQEISPTQVVPHQVAPATPTPKRPLSPGSNPIAGILKKLLTRMDGIMEKHGEVQDTDVREQLHEAVFNAFVLAKVDYVLPEEFGMFTKTGNKRVRSALAMFITKATNLATKAKLEPGLPRLAAFQEIDVTSENGSMYDDYFGDREGL